MKIPIAHFSANQNKIYNKYVSFLVARHKADEALALADQSRARTLEQGLGVDSNVRSFANASLHPGGSRAKTNATLLRPVWGDLWALRQQRPLCSRFQARKRMRAAD